MIALKVTTHFIWSPVALTSGSEPESERGESANETRREWIKARQCAFLPESWRRLWSLHNEDSVSHDPVILPSFDWEIFSGRRDKLSASGADVSVRMSHTEGLLSVLSCH